MVIKTATVVVVVVAVWVVIVTGGGCRVSGRGRAGVSQALFIFSRGRRYLAHRFQRSFPTLAFKCARGGTQRVTHAATSASRAPEGLLRSSHAVVGADELMQLIKNYARTGCLMLTAHGFFLRSWICMYVALLYNESCPNFGGTLSGMYVLRAQEGRASSFAHRQRKLQFASCPLSYGKTPTIANFALMQPRSAIECAILGSFRAQNRAHTHVQGPRVQSVSVCILRRPQSLSNTMRGRVLFFFLFCLLMSPRTTFDVLTQCS